jgi:GTP pyrophosphokinase
MNKILNIEFEKAIRLLAQVMPVANEGTRKPVIFHGLRVGAYLYENNYSRDIVLAGVLHDVLEDTEVTLKELTDEFGENVARIVNASTKDDSITDSLMKTEELIKRCVENGEEALIVKTADIIDSFKYYTEEKNMAEIQYCMRNADAILKYKPKNFGDKIFTELESWQVRYKT